MIMMMTQTWPACNSTATLTHEKYSLYLSSFWWHTYQNNHNMIQWKVLDKAEKNIFTEYFFIF